MKRTLITLAVSVTAVACFSQTKVPVSDSYVLDGETGEFIKIEKTSEQNVQYVNQMVEQPQKIIVVDDSSAKLERAVNTAAQVVTAAVVAGAVIHVAKHHRHYRNHYYCPPPRPRYYHHHYRKPKYRPHRHR